MECRYCHAEFRPIRKNNVYCTAKCRTEHWLQINATPREKIYKDVSCVACGTKFDTGDRRRKFCSRACHIKYHNDRRPTTQLDERACVVCGTLFKPLQKRGVGRRWCSEECRLSIRRGYKPRRNQKELDRKARNAAYQKAWREKKGGSKNVDLRKKYGITLQQYNAMLETQGGVCAVCRQPETAINYRTGKPRMLCVDHHHDTGKVRALLCTNCNRALGHVLENPEISEAVTAYLKAHI